jgi:hypothetical protein
MGTGRRLMKINGLFAAILIVAAFAGGFFLKEKMSSNEVQENFVKDLIAIRAEMASGDFTQVALIKVERRYRVALDTFLLKTKGSAGVDFANKKTCLEDADIDMQTASDRWYAADQCRDSSKTCSELNVDSGRMTYAATAKVGKCLSLFLE